MDISFATNRLERQMSSAAALKRHYGDRAARLQLRLEVLFQADCLADIPDTPPTRRHELTGDWKGHFAVDVTGNWRLIVRPDHDPVPLLGNGSIDLEAVTAITIVDFLDYH